MVAEEMLLVVGDSLLIRSSCSDVAVDERYRRGVEESRDMCNVEQENAVVCLRNVAVLLQILPLQFLVTEDIDDFRRNGDIAGQDEENPGLK